MVVLNRLEPVVLQERLEVVRRPVDGRLRQLVDVADLEAAAVGQARIGRHRDAERPDVVGRADVQVVGDDLRCRRCSGGSS